MLLELESSGGFVLTEGVLYADFGRRFAARLVDLLILFGVISLVVLTMWVFRAVGIWVPRNDGADLEQVFHSFGIGPKLLITGFYCLAQGLVYSALLEASVWQATVGKRLCGVYVTDDDQNRIGNGRSFGRSLTKIFMGFFGGTLVSILLIMVTKDRKTLHDYIVNTVVLRGVPASTGALEPWRLAVGLGSLYVWMLGTFMATL